MERNLSYFPFYSWYVIMDMIEIYNERESYFPFYSWYVIMVPISLFVLQTSYFPFYSWYVIISMKKQHTQVSHISLFILGML